MRWGDHTQALPLKVLEGLATTMALAAEEWRPPVWGVFQEFDRLAEPVLAGTRVSRSDLGDRVICVDAAWDLCRYQVGGLIPGWESALGYLGHGSPTSNRRSSRGWLGRCGWQRLWGGGPSR